MKEEWVIYIYMLLFFLPLFLFLFLYLNSSSSQFSILSPVIQYSSPPPAAAPSYTSSPSASNLPLIISQSASTTTTTTTTTLIHCYQMTLYRLTGYREQSGQAGKGHTKCVWVSHHRGKQYGGHNHENH